MAGLLRYPYEAITQTTDYLQIRIFHYERSGVTGGPKPPAEGQAFDVSNYVSDKAKVLDQNGVIILPMPSNIQDSNSVSYDNDSLNKFAADGVQAVKTMMESGGKAVSDFLLDFLIHRQNEHKNDAGEKVMGDLQTAIQTLTSNSAKQALNTQLAIQAVNLFGANVSFNSFTR